MKPTKQLLKTSFAIFCMVVFASIAFANPQAPPVGGIGIVVKKNPGSGASKAVTDKEGHFSLQLEEGEYTLELQPEQLQRAMAELIKNNYPNSKYKFNGSGIQLDLDKGSKLRMVQSERTDSNRSVPSYRVLVPKGGAVLWATLSWNDAVMGKTKTEQDKEIGDFSPPKNIFPEDGKVLTDIEYKQPVNFKWTPIVPRPLNNVAYKLRIWMAKEGEQAEKALETAKVIFEKETIDQTQLSVNLDGLWPCRPNCMLLWQVVATDNKQHDYVGHVTLLR